MGSEFQINNDLSTCAEETDTALVDCPERQLMEVTSKVYDTIASEVKFKNTLSISEAINDPRIARSREAALGVSDLYPSTVEKCSISGIFPGSKQEELKRLSRQRGQRLKAATSLEFKTLEETHGYRIRATYRLIRYMAWLRGDLFTSEMLIPQIKHKLTVPEKLDYSKGYDLGVKGLRALLLSWDHMPNTTFTYYDGREFHVSKGPTYLPPAIPDYYFAKDLEAFGEAPSDVNIWQLRKESYVPECYDANEDLSLAMFMETFMMLGDHMEIDKVIGLTKMDGAEHDPDYEEGILSIAGLFSANTCRMAWPTPDELQMYEEALALRIFDRAVEEGDERQTASRVAKEYSMKPQEALDFVKMAKKVGTQIYNQGSEEEKKQLLIQRVARITNKAEENLDLRAALAGTKQEGILCGFAKQEQTTDLDELRGIVTGSVGDEEDDI